MKPSVTPIVRMKQLFPGGKESPRGFLVGFDGDLTEVTELVLPKNCCLFVGERAFRGFPRLCRVVLSEGIRALHSEAFLDCPALSEVVLPTTLTEIGEEAFSGCESLSRITYTGSEEAGLLPPALTMIGADAFRGCHSLERLVFPAALRRIEGCPFYDSGIRDFTFLGLDAIESIADNAFAGCYDATFHLPDTCRRPELPYAPEMGTPALPDAYLAAVRGTPILSQARNLVFSYPSTEQDAELVLDCPFSFPELLDTLTAVSAFIVRDGILVGYVTKSGADESPKPVLVGGYVHVGYDRSYYHTGDNNGAGYLGDDPDNCISTPTYSRLQYREP